MRPAPHLFSPTLLNDGTCAECGLVLDSPVHIDAPGRTPQRADAGQTSRESHVARSKSQTRQTIYNAIVEAARAGKPACDWDLEHTTGIPWRMSTGARNGLCCDGLVAPILDPYGKTNPLKLLVDGKRLTVCDGPWQAKPNPAGRGMVIVWVPTDGPYGGWTQ